VPGHDATSFNSPACLAFLNPTTPMASFSANALRDYALVKSPSTQISPSTLLLDSPECIAIFDAYPKAKYHFLILPRYPFPHKCNIDYLNDLKALLGAPQDVRRAVVEGMRSMAGEVVEMIRDEMMKTEGFTWGIDLGFHAIPSMR
jgi:aprataxin